MLKYDDIDMVKLIEDSIASVDKWAKDKNINIEIAKEPMQTVNGDPERLYQVITNLISNALKFTPENGNVKVSIFVGTT